MAFDAETYKSRRERLYQKLPETFAMVVPPSGSKPSSADASFGYVPNKNLVYLTGIEQENSWLLASRSSEGKLSEILLIDRYDKKYEQWIGTRLTTDEAGEKSGIEKVKYNDRPRAVIDTMLIKKQQQNLFIDYPLRGMTGIAGTRLGLAGDIARSYPHLKLARLSEILFELRMVKEPAEVEMIRKAIALTRRGFERAARRLEPGIIERELEAEMVHEWILAGERIPAFPPIVAGGDRAWCLHYQDNDRILEDGQLVLIDHGAQWKMYNADITRTIPVNGRYTDRQRKLMNLVIEVQRKSMNLLRPGKLINGWKKEVQEYYAGRLAEEGIISEESEVGEVYYHGVGHHLGMDTHDEFLVDKPITPGMVLTVEPGFYSREEGIGIRIEDDVLVLEEGLEVLSEGFPRTPDEIEELMGSR